MKDLFKLCAIAVISVGGLARTCTKSASTAVKISHPIMDARHFRSTTELEHSFHTTSQFVKYEDEMAKATTTVKNTKDVVDIADKTQDFITIDTVKIIIKKKK